MPDFFSDLSQPPALSHVRHVIDQFVEGDRVVAHADAGGVVDSIRDSGGRSAQAEFPIPFAFVGDDTGSTSSRKITSW